MAEGAEMSEPEPKTEPIDNQEERPARDAAILRRSLRTLAALGAFAVLASAASQSF